MVRLGKSMKVGEIFMDRVMKHSAGLHGGPLWWGSHVWGQILYQTYIGWPFKIACEKAPLLGGRRYEKYMPGGVENLVKTGSELNPDFRTFSYRVSKSVNVGFSLQKQIICMVAKTTKFLRNSLNFYMLKHCSK